MALGSPAPAAPVYPEGWTASHVGAAHCHRFVGRAPGGRWRARLECRWPPGGGTVLASECSAPAPGPAADLRGLAPVRAFAATGAFGGAARFDTERALAADHVALCEGRIPASPAVPVPDTLATAWIEHASARPSGCRWLTLSPATARLRGPLGGPPVSFDAATPYAARPGSPALLASCCVPAPGARVAPAPLFVFLTVDPFDEDPVAHTVLNPLAWPAIGLRAATGRDHFYDAEATLRWLSPDGRDLGAESVRVTRSASTWSTRTDYRADVSPLLFDRVLRAEPRPILRIESPGLRGTLRLSTGVRTRTFLDACAALPP